MHRLFDLNRPRWYLLALLVVVTSVLEALAAALVFALVGLVASGSLDLPLVGRVSADSSLVPFALGVVAFFVVRAALVVAHEAALYRLTYGAGARLEEQLLRGYLSLPPRTVRRRGHAELVRNVHDTVMTVVEDCLIPSVLAVGHLLRAAAILTVMVVVAPAASLVVALLFAPLLWLLARGVRGPAHRLGEQVEAALAESLSAATEALNLVGDIRVAGRTDQFARRFGDIRRRIARAGGMEETIRSVPRLATETTLVLFVVGYLAVASVGGDASAALPALGLFAYAALRVLPSLIGLVAVVHSVAHSGPAVRTVLADEALLRNASGPRRPVPPPAEVRLEDVSVQVPETGRVVLEGVDLTLRRGDVVAVVGTNGSGKSTLVDVLAGVLAPVSGRLTVDGRPVLEGDGDWAEQVALVAQHVHLLDADIPTNVTLDVSGAPVTDPRATALISAVGLAPVVDRLAGSTVGEDGRALSGGERQRVALARGLYRPAGLLLVDEGTSALDAAGRATLLDLVIRHRQDRITVLVTHDPVLTEQCTRILHVADGRVRVDEPLPRPV
jgi:ABC-type multidrug transport system fused ATPase/permease subunit